MRKIIFIIVLFFVSETMAKIARFKKLSTEFEYLSENVQPSIKMKKEISKSVLNL